MLRSVMIVLICLFIAITIVYSETTPVRIGFLADFTSISKSYSENIFNAALLAVNKFNKSGGFSGRPIELVKRDGGIDPEIHYNQAVQLIKEEKVVAIFGGASSPVVLKISEACKKYKIPFLVSIGNSQAIVIEYGHPYIFQFLPTSSMETKAFSIFTTLMPWQRYAWIGPDYPWGHDVLNNFKRQFDTIGTTLKWTAEEWHPLGTTDFSSIVDSILKGKPDALVISSWGEDVRHFTIQAKSRDLFHKLAVFGWFTYDMTGDMGQIVPEGMWCLARGGPFNYLTKKFPQTQSMVDEFHKLYNSYPIGFSLCCYDSLLAWWGAIHKVKTVNPRKVAQALKGIEFTGLHGESYIRDVDGQMNSATYFGRLTYQDSFPFAVWDSIIEIPAEKIWLSEKEVLQIRNINRD